MQSASHAATTVQLSHQRKICALTAIVRRDEPISRVRISEAMERVVRLPPPWESLMSMLCARSAWTTEHGEPCLSGRIARVPPLVRAEGGGEASEFDRTAHEVSARASRVLAE